MLKPHYQTLGLGGTFDHFHAGHQKFLRFASTLSNQLRIGITDEKLTLHKEWPETIQPFSERNRTVLEFCHQQGITATTFRLQDIYGPTIEKSEVQALAVTDATVDGAQAINELRAKLQLRELPVHVCTLFKTDSGQPLSSTLIRAGLFNREGNSYSNWIANDLILTSVQRAEFRKPQGPIISQFYPGAHGITVVVGDRCLAEFIDRGWQYSLGVFDTKTERQHSHFTQVNSLEKDYVATNLPGQISLQLMSTLSQINWQQKKHLFINGEEDLVTVALVLLLPLESRLYYGQPQQGMISLTITENLKKHFLDILQS